jgi:hypothetical protein
VGSNLRRGFLRIGIGSTLLWLAFWTLAYVIKPVASENALPPPTLTLSADLLLIAAAVSFLPWIISGFRAK